MSSSVPVKIKYLANAGPEHYKVQYSTCGSVGIDLQAWIRKDCIVLSPGERHPFPAGIALEITQPGIAGFIFSRSGLGTKQGLVVSQGVGVIDPDYRGEIIVSLLNNSMDERTVLRGQRIAQLVFMPWIRASLEQVSELSPTQRGSGGFGHTGF